MLAQTLNQGFVVAVADETTQLIARTLADRQAGVFGAPTPLDDIDTPTLEAFAADLKQSADAQKAAGSEDLDQAEQVGDRPPPPKEDYVFMPRDQLLGLLQTAFESAVKDAAAPVPEEPMVDDRRSGPLPVVTDRSLVDLPLRLSDDDRRVWGKFEVSKLKFLSDPLWVKSVIAMAHRRVHGRSPWNPKPTIAPAMADDARIVILGDWGSGLPRAREVAKQIEKVLDDPTESRRETHVVHLGDVYYSGEKDEYRDYFLDPWPVKARHAGVGSWTLPGNHDMYIGGEGYFDVALKDPRFAKQQGSSWFALANQHWQFLGLDTSYEDGGLYSTPDADQAQWVRKLRADNPDKKTVLLTHHQLFSAYQEGAEPMKTKIQPILADKEIDAWFWGHEHRCLAYRDVQRVRYATCVGHGGIPEYLHQAGNPTFPGLAYEYRKIHSTDWQPWITFGFCVVTLNGPKMTIEYIDEDGNKHCTMEHE